uniref:Lipoprotein n=1 Tax=Strongyloides papillosus TaxID=174720 RepID=A0A0N5BU63_STREA
MNGNNFTLQYTLPSNRTIKGKSFSCNLLPYLKELKLLNNTDFVDLTKEKVPEPKVVTAISDNHLAFKGDCHMNGNNFTLQYTLPSNRTIKGKSFSCNLLPYLKELKLLNNTDFVDLTKEKVPEL